jgi:hypothetical protein
VDCNGGSSARHANRNLTCLGLLMLVGLMTLWAPEPTSAVEPTLTVENVLPPVPSGTEPGGEMYLRATVTGDGSGTVVFYLGQSSSPGPNDVKIGSTGVTIVGGSGTVGVAGRLPQRVSPGFYYLLACSGAGECAASSTTIDVIGQALSAIDQTPEDETTDGWSTLGSRYFPENSGGMSVSDRFDCPISAHGQYPANCVWVTTPRVSLNRHHRIPFSAFHCPGGYPYPYQVAIGFDPLWEDRSSNAQVSGETRPVSFTKNRSDLFGPFSYAGTGSGDPGYAMLRWGCFLRTCGIRDFGQARYVCADKKSNAAYP